MLSQKLHQLADRITRLHAPDRRIDAEVACEVPRDDLVEFVTSALELWGRPRPSDDLLFDSLSNVKITFPRKAKKEAQS